MIAHPGDSDDDPSILDLAFLAWLASLGLLTMKGIVESLDDPLLHWARRGFARMYPRRYR